MGDVAGAEALSGFAEDGAVFDERDEELDACCGGGGGRRRADEVLAAVGDAKVSAADEGEYVEDALGWYADGVEFLEDFDDASAGAGGVVEVFV